MSAHTTPSTLALSVVLIMPDGFDGIAKAIRHLQVQTIVDQLEIVLVTASADEAHVDKTALGGFGAWRLIELPGLSQGGAARAAGVRQARAPFVVLAEDHCFPAPNWAEALLDAFHSYPEAGAIVPSITNGNPRTLTSWADAYMNFGPYLDRSGPAALGHLPWHNACFRREAFARHQAELPHLLEVESLWHGRLLEDGYTLRITAAAQIRHHNFSRLGFFLRVQYVNGRIFGSARAEPMPVWRQWLHACAAPLVQVTRFRGVVNEMKRSGRLGMLPRLLPLLALGMMSNGWGEFVGYAVGAGRSKEAKFDFESRRYRFMTEADRRDLLDLNPPSPRTGD